MSLIIYLTLQLESIIIIWNAFLLKRSRDTNTTYCNHITKIFYKKKLLILTLFTNFFVLTADLIFSCIYYCIVGFVSNYNKWLHTLRCLAKLPAGGYREVNWQFHFAPLSATSGWALPLFIAVSVNFNFRSKVFIYSCVKMGFMGKSYYLTPASTNKTVQV